MIRRENMTTKDLIQEYLSSLGIDQPVQEFVRLVSNTFHKYESQYYDEIHDEICEAASHWQNALRCIETALPNRIRVLDIGAGTGFASKQVLRALHNRISTITCQDLSTDMLSKCRDCIVPQASKASIQAQFVAGTPEKLLDNPEPTQYHLVVTNAVLHHLLDLGEFFKVIERLVLAGGFYIAGQEPCRRFYLNKRVHQWTKRYIYWKRAKRLFSPRFYIRRVTRKRPHHEPGIEESTNDALIRAGVITTALPHSVIRKLIDIHVPTVFKSRPSWGETGFEPSQIRSTYLPDFEIVRVITYSHIKDKRAHASILWRIIDRALAKRCPDSGADFIMVMRRLA